MNRTTRFNGLYTYHTITNVEFTGVLDRFKIYGYIGDYGTPEIFTQCVNNIYDYHLFIKYGDKVYMDVKCVGEIVMSFAELQKNKYWKHYYDLSLMLTNNKHLVIQDLEYSSNYYDPNIYFEERSWSINTAYIEGSYDAKTKSKIVLENEYNCYYKINPYDLENMEYSSQQNLDIFTKKYVGRYEVGRYDIRKIPFDKKSAYYYNIVFDYCISLMEKELDELSDIFEDKKNMINLVELNDKQGMNNDILMLIYNHLAISESSESIERKNKYDYIMNELGNRNRLESVAMIMAA